jgi:4-azaleucine resistance transporter AzlC
MFKKNIFIKGFRAILPVITGVIPFGIVMGTVASHAGLDFSQSFFMNVFVFAGAAQLAAIELMTKNTESIVVVATGLIINLRFLLYSAALSPDVQKSRFITKFFSAYFITDQNYAVMMANQSILKTSADSINFYFGASLCMMLAWHASVAIGFIFGNVAPEAWSLDYAVPLSFISLVLPTMKDRRYVYVAIFSSVVALLLNGLPYRLGLILTSLMGITLGIFLSQRKKKV